MLPWPVLGSRTWMWAIAAPALAAPIAASAISLGVTGIAGCLPMGPPPVTAHVMMVFAMVGSSRWHPSKTTGSRERARLRRVHGDARYEDGRAPGKDVR